MLCRYHRLAEDKIDYELVWLLVSLGSFLGLAIWLSAGLGTPQCAFHALTGLPCVTCGATRSAWQFLHGHFVASIRFNPLAFGVYCGIVVFDFYALAVLLFRAPRLRLREFSRAEKQLIRGVGAALLAANWIYLITARPF